ncbi:MAG: glycosyltransferase family 39 protein [Candidatus Woesearchaeota archaeon]
MGITKTGVTKKDKKEIIILIIILFLALSIRVINTNKTIVFDEFVQTNAVINHNPAGLDDKTEIPPLTTWTRIAFVSIFGLSTQSLKMVSVIFGILTILTVYFLAKELYDKKTAFISIILLGFSAWHILGSTSISFDGAFLTFYYVLTIFFFVKYSNTKRNQTLWLVLTGISFGLAMLTKLNAILLLPILIIYYFLNNYYILEYKDIEHKNSFQNNFYHKFIEAVKIFFIICLIALAIFSVFPISAYFTDWSYFQVVLSHTSVFSNNSFEIVLLLIQLMLSVFWAGPLFIGLYALSFLKFEKKDILLHLWIAVVFLFFILGVQENFRPFERYLLVILPALAILGGKVIKDSINDLKLEKKHWSILGITLLLFTAIIFIFNLLHNRILPFYPKSGFISNALSFNWNFLVPLTGDQGPIGMYISFNSIMFAFIFAAIFVIFYIITYIKNAYLSSKKTKKNNNIKNFSRMFLILFLSISFSYNVFIAQEMIWNLTNVNIDKVSKETINYALEKDLEQPIIIFRNYALKYYLENKYQTINTADFNYENNQTLLSYINGTLLFIDFPAINQSSLLAKRLNRCNILQKFIDKGITVGYIYSCPS